MLKKKKGDDELTAPAGPAKKKQDEHAYEDAWYRALKAQSERPADEDETTDAVED